MERKRDEIIANILRITENEAVSKLQIMDELFLTFRQATDYLDKLVTECVLKYDATFRLYSIAEKGWLSGK